ncbi:hypothetical protein COBT_000045 [Conglomerata obtusa]
MMQIKQLPGLVHHYHVSFVPEINRKYIRSKYCTLLKEHKETLFKCVNTAFDGASMLVTNQKLTQDNLTIYYKTGSESNVIECQMIISYKNSYNLQDIDRIIKTKSQDDISTHLQCLEIILKEYQSQKFFTDQNKMYTGNDVTRLSEKLIICNGINQSLKVTHFGVMCNIDLSFNVYYDSLNLVEVLEDILKAYLPYNARKDSNMCFDDLLSQSRDLKRSLSTLESFLKRIKLVSIHQQRNISFKLVGITDQTADKLNFTFENRMINVAEYFGEKYFRLRYPNLPCIVKQNKDKSVCYFPMEVLKIYPSQKYVKKLNERELSQMVRIAAQQPTDRFQNLHTKINELELDKNTVLDQFKVSIDKKFIECTGKLLNPPRIQYNMKQSSVLPERGSWNMRNVTALSPITVDNWIICFLNNSNLHRNELRDGINSFLRYSQAFGMRLNPNYLVESINTPNDYNKLINSRKPEFIMFILSANRNEVYEQVKRISETRNFKVVTQCIYIANLKKFKDPSFCSNIMIKINVKLSGKNWKLDKDSNLAYKKKGTIVFGADVSHPGIGDLESPSITAVVSNTDQDMNSFSTDISYQTRRLEIIKGLRNTVFNMLNKYRIKSEKFPERIIFFRDGIGETQFKDVYDQEICAIKEACSDINLNYKPEVNFVVAQKRHSVRFCTKNNQRLERSKGPTGNVPAGTVIEDIRHYINKDFYMVTHHAIQGTAHPVRYQVLLNESSFSRNDVYEMINNMCHLYPRATKAVSIVPVVYFAHLAAARGKCYLKGGIERGNECEKIDTYENQLFYL